MNFLYNSSAKIEHCPLHWTLTVEKIGLSAALSSLSILLYTNVKDIVLKMILKEGYECCSYNMMFSTHSHIFKA